MHEVMDDMENNVLTIFFIIIIVIGIYMMVHKGVSANSLGFIYVIAGVIGLIFSLCERDDAALTICWVVTILLIVQLGTIAFLGTVDLSRGVKVY
jgi:inner membrane protein involved in colicin E2 resistance